MHHVFTLEIIVVSNVECPQIYHFHVRKLTLISFHVMMMSFMEGGVHCMSHRESPRRVNLPVT